MDVEIFVSAKKKLRIQRKTGYAWTGPQSGHHRESQNLTSPTILVVYHLHGQTGGSTVWVNGT